MSIYFPNTWLLYITAIALYFIECSILMHEAYLNLFQTQRINLNKKNNIAFHKAQAKTV